MAKGKDRGVVSVWFWFFACFVELIPCVGFVMTLVWAFAGSNESRKNYFRARLAWALMILVLWGGLVVAGLAPEIKAAMMKALGQAPQPLFNKR